METSSCAVVSGGTKFEFRYSVAGVCFVCFGCSEALESLAGLDAVYVDLLGGWGIDFVMWQSFQLLGMLGVYRERLHNGADLLELSTEHAAKFVLSSVITDAELTGRVLGSRPTKP